MRGGPLIGALLALAALALVVQRGGWVPTRRLIVALVLLAPIWILSSTPSGLAVAAGISFLLATLVIADGALAPGRSIVRVSRELPATIGIGDRAQGAVKVRSWRTEFGVRPKGKGRRLNVAVFQALPRGLEHEGMSVSRASGRLDDEIEMAFAVRGAHRGKYLLGPLAVRIGGPLGLVERTTKFALSDEITVAPSIAGVRRFRLLSLQHRLREAGVRNIRKRGEGTTFESLREYVIGDDPRHIDWKATAKRQKLIAREYAVEQGQTVLIAVDAGRMMTQFAGPLPRFEYALSSAMVLADVALDSGDQVGAIVFDDQVRAFVPPQRGGAALQAIRQALIPLRATMVEPDYAAAFRTLASRHRKRSLIIVFTDVIDTRASQALIAHTTRSAVRHLPVVVALGNDQLVAAAVPNEASTTGDLYESAAAEELLLARAEAMQRMRQAGVSVLDVSPHAMTAAVINHYLEVKARASL
ncbi:MAG TPA: DUF58 domain-containing protein [Gemmatimonadaceae bacterium]|nr:DUF58 domain-containing protein [Gemmatimonadaceae bacterium]